MTEPESSPVPAPFDQLPDPESDGGRSGDQSRTLAMKAGLVLLFLVCLGFGQGIALTRLFDGPREDLSTMSDHLHEHHPSREPEPGPAEVPPTVPITMPEIDVEETAAPSDRHVLEIARERFDLGDAEGARRMAAAYLLRIDGMGHADSLRAPFAYAVLGDVLRRDFQRSLQREEN